MAATAYDAALAWLQVAEGALLNAQRCLRGAQGGRDAALEAQRKVYERACQAERDRIVFERAYLEALDTARVQAETKAKKRAA